MRPVKQARKSSNVSSTMLEIETEGVYSSPIRVSSRINKSITKRFNSDEFLTYFPNKRSPLKASPESGIKKKQKFDSSFNAPTSGKSLFRLNQDLDMGLFPFENVTKENNNCFDDEILAPKTPASPVNDAAAIAILSFSSSFPLEKNTPEKTLYISKRCPNINYAKIEESINEPLKSDHSLYKLCRFWVKTRLNRVELHHQLDLNQDNIKNECTKTSIDLNNRPSLQRNTINHKPFRVSDNPLSIESIMTKIDTYMHIKQGKSFDKEICEFPAPEISIKDYAEKWKEVRNAWLTNYKNIEKLHHKELSWIDGLHLCTF